MAHRWGNNGNSERLYFWGAPKSLQMATVAMKLPPNLITPAETLFPNEVTFLSTRGHDFQHILSGEHSSTLVELVLPSTKALNGPGTLLSTSP